MNKLLILAACLAMSSTAIAQDEASSAWDAGDYQTAVRIWAPAASQGDADALYRIAVAYQEGKGVDKNIPLATDLMMRSSSLGHMLATSEIGLMLYRDGRRAQAMYYLKQAAGNDDARAAYIVGVAMYNGDDVQEDREGGLLFLQQAAKSGFNPAQEALNTLAVVPIQEASKPLVIKPYTIRLGAFRVDGNAERLWKNISAKIQFGDNKPSFVAFKDLTLLKISGFTRDEARAMCVRIKATKTECVVE